MARRSRKLDVTNHGASNTYIVDTAQTTTLVKDDRQPPDVIVCEDTAGGAIAHRALSRRISTESNGALQAEILTETKTTSSGPDSTDASNKENTLPHETDHEVCHSNGATLLAHYRDPVSSDVRRTTAISTLPETRKGTPRTSREGGRKPNNPEAASQLNGLHQLAAVAATKGNDKGGAEVHLVEHHEESNNGKERTVDATSDYSTAFQQTHNVENDDNDTAATIAAATVLFRFRSQAPTQCQPVEALALNGLGPSHSTTAFSGTAVITCEPLRRSGRDRKPTFKVREAERMAKSKAEGKSKKAHRVKGQATTTGMKRRHEEIDIEDDEVVELEPSKHGRIEPETPEEANTQHVTDLSRPRLLPTPPSITTGWIVADAVVHRYIQVSSLRQTQQDARYIEPSEEDY